jgi:hypothetical protein
MDRYKAVAPGHNIIRSWWEANVCPLLLSSAVAYSSTCLTNLMIVKQGGIHSYHYVLYLWASYDSM